MELTGKVFTVTGASSGIGARTPSGSHEAGVSPMLAGPDVTGRAPAEWRVAGDGRRAYARAVAVKTVDPCAIAVDHGDAGGVMA
jgi:NAD(P)-dependent dehydrogenase (short-subunit alcohol dehydrogenase family)